LAETRVVVYRPAQFEPATLQLGQVAPGESINKQVCLDEYAKTADEFPATTPRFSISSIHHDPIQLSVSDPIVESAGDGLFRRRTAIQLCFPVANREGYSEFLVMQTPTDAASHVRPSFRVNWSVASTVELSPARIALTFPQQGETRQTKIVCVRPLNGHHLQVDQITTSSPGIQARIRTKPRLPTDGAEIEVSVQLDEGTWSLAGDVIIRIGDLGTKQVRIPITAFRAVRR
jgi:hypothetical protein